MSFTSPGKSFILPASAVLIAPCGALGRWYAALVSFAVLLVTSVAAVAEPLSPGDILVADTSLNCLFKIDPATGNRTIFSDATHGSGPAFSGANVLAIEADGSILVGNQGSPNPSVYRVDPATGNRALLSSSSSVPGAGRGTGPAIARADGLAVGANGAILMSDWNQSRVLLIDPVSGDRTIYSDNSGSHGTGFPFVNPTVGYNNEVYVTNEYATNGNARVFRVTPDHVVISDNLGTGSGPTLNDQVGMTFDANGNILIANHSGNPGVYMLDPNSLVRSIVSDNSNSHGTYTQTFAMPYGLAFDLNGNLLVTDESRRTLSLVDPTTGNRTVLSDNSGSHGTGPTMTLPRGVVVVAVPEPATWLLTVIAAWAGIIALRRRGQLPHS